MTSLPGASAMHIGIAGPMTPADLRHLLHPSPALVPRGYPGAPFLATLVGELIGRGHRVSAFTLSSDLPLDAGAVVLRGPSLTLHCVPMRPRAWPFNGRLPGRIVDLYRFERRGLERAMRGAIPDLVHAHWSYEFAWAALASGLPHVVTCHDSPVRIARLSRGPTRRGYRWLRAAMARHVLRRAGRVTAVSPYMSEQIGAWCAVPVAVVPNPIDLRSLVPRRRHSATDRITVCMVGNGWSEFKNPRAALLAFDLLVGRMPGVQLVACGDDFEQGGPADLWWRAQGLRGRVEFRGRVAHDDVLALMARSDALLHPALEESFGTVVAEALAIGLPVVAGRRSGAVPWLVGGNGWLVDVASPEAIAEALVCALDGEEAMTRAELGRESVRRRFAPAAVAAAYEAQYRLALRDRASSGGA